MAEVIPMRSRAWRKVAIRQFAQNGQGLDNSVWIVPDGYALHILTYDVLIKGCVRVEYTEVRDDA
jgi:hypothetical protein